jgi:hypothetical protein
VTDRATAQEVQKVVSEARVQLRATRDAVGARELAARADAMLLRMEAAAQARADILGALSSLWLDLGDERRSEELIVEAIAAEGQVVPARPVILGTRKLFYAKLLHAQRRSAEAAQQASDGLAIYMQGVEPDHPEIRRLRVELAPILKAAGDQSAELALGVRAMAERLCAVANGTEAEILAALAVPTNPPPLGASECLVTAGELSRASVELRFPAGVLMKGQLDATFGAANELPRTGPRAAHVLGYDLRVAGAPARISVYARFAEPPRAETSAKSVLLRIDRA